MTVDLLSTLWSIASTIDPLSSLNPKHNKLNVFYSFKLIQSYMPGSIVIDLTNASDHNALSRVY